MSKESRADARFSQQVNVVVAATLLARNNPDQVAEIAAAYPVAAPRLTQLFPDRAAEIAAASTATKQKNVAIERKLRVAVIGFLAFVAVAMIVSAIRHHPPHDCYNNGVQILHGTAYNGSCDPNVPPPPGN
jgi:hypothetical protein